MRTILFLVMFLAIAPVATASMYVGAGEVDVSIVSIGAGQACDPGTDASYGNGCEFVCHGTCTVTVTAQTGLQQKFKVCDWDGASDVRCVGGYDSRQYTSQTSNIDVIAVNGAAGTITVS